ncbi:MAG: hypothetical protein ABI742_10745 [Gemmatimonadota bacterium]
MATVEQTMMKVQRLLTGPMNLRITLAGDSFSVRFEDVSTSVQIRVQDWGKGKEGDPRTLVLLSSLILKGVTPSPALFEWVARQGGSRWFGHVEVYEDSAPGTVYLLMSHTLLGDYLDEKELESAMWAVLSAADAWDDELQQKFGGKRWVDA